MLQRINLFVVILITAISLVAIRCDADSTFPFVIPWDDASASITDVSALNPTPAGVNGSITARNGHFFDNKGNRIRFLGVNMTFSACFPDKMDAEKVAAHLHKCGVNLIRFHHMDNGFAPNGIFDPKFTDHQHLDVDQLDRLDYFIYQLKLHGIYSNLNLHVSRKFDMGDGFSDAQLLPEADKGVDYFDARMIALQKKYASDLLMHTNPYTKSKYTEEPAIAIVEITNEDSLVDQYWNGSSSKLPQLYSAMLQAKWNSWLKKKYETTEGLKRSWSASDKPYGPNILLNGNFARGAERWNLELNRAPASARMELPENLVLPAGVDGHPLQLNIQQLGSEDWHIQLHQGSIDLTEDEPYTATFWAKAAHPRTLGVYTCVDRDDYHHIGLDSKVELGTDWKLYSLAFTASKVLKDHCRLTFVLGGSKESLDLAGITLRPGTQTDFSPAINLEKESTSLASPSATPSGVDWVSFLLDTERTYMQEMRDYLKKEIKLQACLTGSQVGYGGIAGAWREQNSDFTDSHAYWQHPEFPNNPWDPKDWKIKNTSMVRDPDGGTLADLARYRIAGKPFIVSEYNHPTPNEFQAECLPMIASFAALQDWDGIVLFDYNSDRKNMHTTSIDWFFLTSANPAKMAFFPAAAMLFLRNDMPLANGELRLRIPDTTVTALMAKQGRDIDFAWRAAGFQRRDAITKRLSISFGEGKKPLPAPDPNTPAPKPDSDIINTSSSKGPIDWQVTNVEMPVYTADSPYSKVMVGQMSGRTVELPGWMVEVSTSTNNFASMMLTALDGKPMEKTRLILLTVIDKAENSGMIWNQSRTSVGDQWGTGPVQVDGVAALITIHTVRTAPVVYALAPTGKRLGKIESKLHASTLTFNISPVDHTVWYEIDISAGF